jgi:dimethylhistidine N-methyltransferase
MNNTSIHDHANPLIEKARHFDMDIFCQEVISGLLATKKHLDSKYFYDEKGDALFRKIMNSPEYYLSRCEHEILNQQSTSISKKILQYFHQFDVIELGPGDASKSIHLLRAFNDAKANFSYIPIDISKYIIEYLEKNIPNEIRGVKTKGLVGEYLEMLKSVIEWSSSPKVILFLGSTIGNLDSNDALTFCKMINSLLSPGDLLFIGFDLKKDPDTILAAYNDKQGITRDFNLNLLVRLNRELGANFDIKSFKHFPTYDPGSGLCKSYLISKTEQTVFIEKANTLIYFKANEAIFMETSMKYSMEETEKLAQNANFSVENHFLDSRKWFLDSLWRKTGEQQVFPTLSCP